MTRRNRNSRRNESAPGWVWMLFGLGLGLVVAVGVYLRAPATSTTAGVVDSRVAPAKATAKPTAAPTTPAAPAKATENRFDFYEILPQFEVVVPERDARTAPPVRTRPVEEPGRYLLQAGSFSTAADADRLQAYLGRFVHHVNCRPSARFRTAGRPARGLRNASNATGEGAPHATMEQVSEQFSRTQPAPRSGLDPQRISAFRHWPQRSSVRDRSEDP